jgi:hypothetical protein
MSTISSSLPQTNTAVTTAPKTPVVAQSNAGAELAQTAVNISSEASVVSTFSGTSGTGYDAVSLLNFLQQSTPTTSLPGATGGSSDPTTIDTSGSAAGSVADWSALLKQNPALAYTAATANFNQAVLSTLKIVA